MLEELKKELQLTYEDADVDQRLQRYLKEGTAELEKIAGISLNEESDEVKPLLFAYCRYAFYHALEQFKTNYYQDLISFQWRVAIQKYDSQPEEGDV